MVKFFPVGQSLPSTDHRGCVIFPINRDISVNGTVTNVGEAELRKPSFQASPSGFGRGISPRIPERDPDLTRAIT